MMSRNHIMLYLLLPALFFCRFHYQAIAQKPVGDIPPFKILQTNGRYFSAADLPKNKPVVLIYFSPDCEHCQVLMDQLFPKINAFKNAELVMVTFKPVEELAGFEKKYQTYKYPNIKVGTEGTTFFLRYYYRLTNTPFTIVYNKNGKVVCNYRMQTPVDDLISQIKKLG